GSIKQDGAVGRQRAQRYANSGEGDIARRAALRRHNGDVLADHITMLGGQGKIAAGLDIREVYRAAGRQRGRGALAADEIERAPDIGIDPVVRIDRGKRRVAADIEGDVAIGRGTIGGNETAGGVTTRVAGALGGEGDVLATCDRAEGEIVRAKQVDTARIGNDRGRID